ncbi:hypothetical protein ACQPZP_02030 [Spirillospora sp. CA-142024]|uniref:hypothetical protein n=1 Tax=Spirillospora sp. CA-142024 TaxID=3240036 RepID=UPI003D8F3EEF
MAHDEPWVISRQDSDGDWQVESHDDSNLTVTPDGRLEIRTEDPENPGSFNVVHQERGTYFGMRKRY